MSPLQSDFGEHDYVRITDGPMHGFHGTVHGFPSPGKLAVTLDELGDNRCLIVSESWVEIIHEMHSCRSPARVKSKR